MEIGNDKGKQPGVARLNLSVYKDQNVAMYMWERKQSVRTRSTVWERNKGVSMVRSLALTDDYE